MHVTRFIIQYNLLVCVITLNQYEQLSFLLCYLKIQRNYARLSYYLSGLLLTVHGNTSES